MRLSRRALIRGLATGIVALSPLVAACTDGLPSPSPSVGQSTATSELPAPTPLAESPSPTVLTAPEGDAPASQPTAAPSATPAPAPTAKSTASPTGPKVVRIGISQEPDNLVGWPGGLYVATLAQNLLFSSLVGVNDKVEAIPDLAEQVPTLDNGGAKYVGDGEARQLQVTFRIRQDAKWSNGDPVTAQDVKFTWDLMMNPDSGAAIGTERKYEKVETPDSQTVVFTLLSQKSARAAAAKDSVTYGDLSAQSGPVIDPLYMFGLPGALILPARVLGPLLDGNPRASKKVVDVLSNSDFARKPVGSGPYTLGDWVAGTSLTFQARRDYHRGAPKVASITMLVLPKREVLLSKLQASQLDLVTQDAVQLSDGPSIEPVGGLRAVYASSLSLEHLDLNLDDALFSDSRVRRALYHATNRQELIDKALAGKARIAHSVIAESAWAYDPDVPKYDFDVDRAKSLLDEAGWTMLEAGFRGKGGMRLSVKLQTTDTPTRRKLAALLKEQWGRVGVDLTVEHLPGDAFTDRRTGPLGARTFQVALYSWVGGFDPGVDARFAYHSSSIPSAKDNFQGGNYPGYEIGAADKLLDQGLATLDLAERKRIYGDFQKMIMTGVPVIPLFHWPSLTVVSGRLLGLKPPISAVGETWNAWEWDLG